MSDARRVYRFKWVNYDMERMQASQRARAQVLRRDAAILIARAEQIEEDAAEWEKALESVEPPDA